MYKYHIKVVRVIDGDTIVADVDLGFDVWMKNQHIRLSDIDCAEVRTKDAAEKSRGLLAKQFLHSYISKSTGTLVLLSVDKRDGFGRILGILYTLSGICINDVMIVRGHAKKS